MTSNSSQFCDLSPEELRRVGHAAVELMVEALAAEQADPVLPAVTGEDLRARFDGIGCCASADSLAFPKMF